MIETKVSRDYINDRNILINELTDDYLNIFIPKLEQYIHENLNKFIHETNTFFNIKKFTVDKSVQFFQEGIVLKFGLAAGASIVSWEFIKNFISNIWNKTFGSNAIVVHLDETLKQQLNSTSKVIQGTINVDKDILINPEPANFYTSPLLLITTLIATIYGTTKLIESFSSISEISTLKRDIANIFNRLNSMGIPNAYKYKELNDQKYEQHLSSCKDPDKDAFGLVTINISCPLDAYLSYCAAMIVSLASIYSSKVNTESHIDNMRQLLAIRDEFMINQMLTEVYNKFCFAIDFIYSNDKVVANKWKKHIDTNVAGIIALKQKPKQPIPQLQDFKSNNFGSAVNKNNDYRQNKPNYTRH